MIALVARVIVVGQLFVETTDGVADSMTEMNTCITKPNSSKSGRQQHLSSRFSIAHGILCYSRQILDRLLESPERKDVRDGVATLVCRPLQGILRSRYSFVVGNSSVALSKGCQLGYGLKRVTAPAHLKSMEKDVETSADVDGDWARLCIERVYDAQQGSQSSTGDARLCRGSRMIKDGGSSSFRSRSSSSGHSKQRSKHLVDWDSLANGCIDKVEQFSVGIAGEEIGYLCSVHDRAASYSENWILTE